MQAIRTIPKEVEAAFGEEGARKFVVFLNETFEDQKTNVIQAVSASFHDHVTTEVSKVRLEVADLRTELKTDMANLRTELKTDIANLRAESKSDFADVHRAISDVQKTIASQTKWLLILFLGAATLYPLATKLIDKLLP